MAWARTTRRRLPPRFPCLAMVAACLFQSAVFAQPAKLSIEEVIPLPAPVSQPPGAGILAEFSQPVFPQEEVRAAHHVASPEQDKQIQQAGCTSCGSSLGRLGGGCGRGGCGGGGPLGCPDCLRPPCVPGQHPGCSACGVFGDHHLGRFAGCLYECICCPDPCYDPKWIPLADTAFHVAAARPVIQQRIRWDSGLQLEFPDRGEFFWARQDGQGKGPRPAAGSLVASNRIRWNDLIYYVEAGSGRVSAIVETPYRSMDPDDYPHSAGFADIKVGAKTLLFDCELIQIAMQMLTYIPSGNAFKGLGTGHVSLEPSLLLGLRVGPHSFVQGQISEWIPLGGDPAYESAVLHTHFAFNHEIIRILPDVPLIGTVELNTWSFQDGGYTDPVLGFQRAGGFTYASVGPGIRLFVCDRIDIGFAASFAVSDPHFASQLYTTEFRFRF